MRFLPCKTKLLSLIIGLLLFISCEPRNTSNQKSTSPHDVLSNHDSLVAKIRPLAALLASDRPSVDQIVKVLGGNNLGFVTDTEIEVERVGYKAVIGVSKPKEVSVPLRVTIYPDYDLGVQLKDMKAVFGDWDKVIQSKTSYVRFRYVNPANGQITPIYVHMLNPPSDLQSPVTSIMIRREMQAE